MFSCSLIPLMLMHVDMRKFSPPGKPLAKPVSVRFSKGPAAASLAYRADEKGFAHIKVQNYSLVFLTSTIDKLGPLFKDEKVSEPLPILVEVSNFDLELKVCLQSQLLNILDLKCS